MIHIYICASLVSAKLIKHSNQKQHRGKKGLFKLALPGNSPLLRELRPETPGRNLKTETKIETMEEWCLLACSFTHAQLTCLYIPATST